jgi:predicted RNA binding protein YcfA (HicA-like mRNA interferase family)
MGRAEHCANRQVLVAGSTLALGWQLVGQRGSHQQYEHPRKPGKVTVAGKAGADVPKGTAANILRQAGLRRTSQ